ncbi:hypothetical protein Cgig2_029969 [Carnegiea gigantea]|uniref:Uncharacterized protein n=1 Tax=Carnegiea gigantea TaxID=171969 RepID=A0A9Q1GIQ5_9CARY|nr:hypothetical protein Cgig2_029969 [Carnegiea gigantea]
MSVMTETISRQVFEQVKWAMEVVNSARPLPHFDYVRIPSPHSTERERETSRSSRGGRPYSDHHDRHTAAAVRPSGRPFQGQTAKSTTTSTPYEPAQPQLWDEECSTEVMDTIAGGCAEGMTREKTKKKEQGKSGRLHIGLSTILTTLIFRSPSTSIQGASCLIPCTITLIRRRNKLYLFGVSAPVLCPLSLVDVVEAGLKLEPPFQAPRSPQPWPLKASPPTRATGLFSQPLRHLIQPSAFPRTTSTRSPAPPAFGTSLQLLPLEQMICHYHLLPSNLGGIRVTRVGGRPLDAQERAADSLTSNPHGLRGVVCSWGLGVRFPADQLPELFVSFFSRSTRGGSYSQNHFSVYPKLEVTMKGANKALECTFLACWFTRCCLSSSRQQSALAATCLGVAFPGLKDYQPHPRLLYIKQKESQEQPIPLEKFLRIKRPATVRKKSFLKNFNLGSQFKGSLSLNLLLLLSGPSPIQLLEHKLGDGSGLIILPYVELEVTGRLPLFSRGFPEGVPNWLPSFQSRTFP